MKKLALAVLLFILVIGMLNVVAALFGALWFFIKAGLLLAVCYYLANRLTNDKETENVAGDPR